MKRWMRVVLPPSMYIEIFLIVYVIVITIGYWALGRLAFASEIRDHDLRGSPLLTRDLTVIFAIIAYGAFRAISFQPAYRDEYLRFLKLTAWIPEKPLPLGPVHLVWQDLVVCALLTSMILHHPVLDPSRIFLSGMIVYLLSLSRVFIQCRLWKHFYATLFGVGLTVVFWSTPLLSMGILIAVYFIAYRGIQPSLVTMHVTDVDAFSAWTPLGINTANRKSTLKRLERLAGWPFDVLSPHKPSIRLMNQDIVGIPAHHGILVSLLAGWWTFAIAVPICDQLVMSKYSTADEQVFARTSQWPYAITTVISELTNSESARVGHSAFFGFFALGSYAIFALAMTRLSLYFKGHHPPISIWGRLVTGRWIIPAYDAIFVAPLCILLVAVVLCPILIFTIGISPLFAVPVTVILMGLCAMNLGPTRVHWLLTSPCQIVPSLDYKNKTLGEFNDS